MITHEISLDVLAGGIPPVVKLSQYDKQYSLVIHLYSRYGAFEIESGTGCYLRGVKSDGQKVERSISLSNYTASISGDTALTDVRGLGKFEVCLSKRNKELYSTNFYILVEPSPAERT